METQFLNYTFTTEVLTDIPVGEDWGNLDIDGDGVPGNRPVKVTVYATNSATHRVSLDDWKLSGSNYTEGGQNWAGFNISNFTQSQLDSIEGWDYEATEVTSSPTTYHWTPGDESVDGETIYNPANQQIARIVAYNEKEPYSVDNKVVFWVFPKDDMTMGGYGVGDGVSGNNFFIDLDGDAQPFNNSNSMITSESDEFYLNFRAFLGSDCNFRIVAKPVVSFHGFPIYADYPGGGQDLWGWKPGGVANSNTYSRMSFQRNNDVYQDIGANAPMCLNPTPMFFCWLIPNEGYYLNRHNVAVVSSGSVEPRENDLATGEQIMNIGAGFMPDGTYHLADQGIYYDAIYMKDQGISGIATSSGYEPYPIVEDWCLNDFYNNNGLPMMQDGLYASTFYRYPQVKTYSPTTSYCWLPGCGENEVITHINNKNTTSVNGLFYNNNSSWLATNGDLNGQNLSVLGGTNEFGVIFIDSNSGPVSPGTSFGSSEFDPMWSEGWEWIGAGGVENNPNASNPQTMFPKPQYTGQIPGQHCADEYNCNAVLVGLVGFSNYIPGASPRDIEIQIHGAAMPIDGYECEDYNVQIEM
tara:strand:- start:1492 stop:3234 length:1743 start_codon:yes stop_codon:yes gene_type:complete